MLAITRVKCKGPLGVQLWSVLYPKLCYNEPCYKEVQVYVVLWKNFREEIIMANIEDPGIDLRGFAEWCQAVIPRDGFFYQHQTTMVDPFSCIPLDLQHLILMQEALIKSRVPIRWHPSYWKLTSCVMCYVTSNTTSVMTTHVVIRFYLSQGSDKGMLDKICQHWWNLRKTSSGMQEKSFILV